MYEQQVKRLPNLFQGENNK